jgi:ribonuclease HI
MWAYTSGSFAANGHFAVWPQAHIYFHELRAALAALLDAAATGVSHVALGVDNTAVLYALRSQHSPNSIANLWIRRALESLPSSFAFRVFHVASELNPADEYTRGSRGHHGSLAFLG